MLKIVLFISISVTLLTGCGARRVQLPQVEGTPISEYPNDPVPPWAVGKRPLAPNEFVGYSVLFVKFQKAHQDAYQNAISQVAAKYGGDYAGPMLVMYDAAIVKELQGRQRPKYSLAETHPVEVYWQQFNDNRYRVSLLVKCDVASLKSKLEADRKLLIALPAKDESAHSHALWQAMHALILKKRHSSQPHWKDSMTVYIQKIHPDIDSYLRAAISNTEMFGIQNRESEADAVISGNYAQIAGGVELDLELRRDGTSLWISKAQGYPNRSKSELALPYKHKRWGLTAIAGLVWAGTSYWHAAKYDDYKGLRHKTPSELDAAYDETILPRNLRIGSGVVFGLLYLYNLERTLSHIRTYQERRRQSEVRAYQLTTFAPMPGGVRLTYRF
jgi:hypothetical protein